MDVLVQLGIRHRPMTCLKPRFVWRKSIAYLATKGSLGLPQKMATGCDRMRQVRQLAMPRLRLCVRLRFPQEEWAWPEKHRSFKWFQQIQHGKWSNMKQPRLDFTNNNRERFCLTCGWTGGFNCWFPGASDIPTRPIGPSRWKRGRGLMSILAGVRWFLSATKINDRRKQKLQLHSPRNLSLRREVPSTHIYIYVSSFGSPGYSFSRHVLMFHKDHKAVCFTGAEGILVFPQDTCSQQNVFCFPSRRL